MDTIDALYKVYRDTVSVLQKQKLDRATLKKKGKTDGETDSQTGDSYRIVVDLEWVEAIEKRLRYLDGAIRENRRFIEQTEEIVPISLSRKITSESVKHLARHTNLISKVEDGKVTPERILNVQREESFAIYENRFLYTLLQRLSYFVNTRYQALQQKPEHGATALTYCRSFHTGKNRAELQLSYQAEDMPITKFRMDADPSTLPDIQRVARIRSIINDFLSTPLMKQLAHCEPVRPPIMRTNLMTKNPNFREALDLWIFIESYDKVGYSYIAKDFDGRMEETVKDGIYDMTTVLNFVVQLKSNPPLEEQLSRRFQEAEDARRKQAVEEALNRQKNERARLDAARQDERAAWKEYNERICRLYDKKLETLQQEIGEKLQSQKEEYTAQMDLLEQRHREEMDLEVKQYTQALEEERKSSAEALRQTKDAYEQTLAEQEASFRDAYTSQESRWQAELEAQTQQARDTLTRAMAQRDQQQAREQRQLEEELRLLREKHTAQKKRFEAEKTALERSAKADREALIVQKRNTERMLRELKAENSRKLRELEKKYKRELSDKTAGAAPCRERILPRIFY